MPSNRKSQRERDLETVLRGLIDALDRQHLDGKAPGHFFYSLRVDEWRSAGRKLVARKPRLLDEDAAKSSAA